MKPYYNSRVIQFFQNEQGKNFIDVTAAISPDHAKYATVTLFIVVGWSREDAH